MASPSDADCSTEIAVLSTLAGVAIVTTMVSLTLLYHMIRLRQQNRGLGKSLIDHSMEDTRHENIQLNDFGQKYSIRAETKQENSSQFQRKTNNLNIESTQGTSYPDKPLRCYMSDIDYSLMKDEEKALSYIRHSWPMMSEDQHPRDGSFNNIQAIKETKVNDTTVTENATQSSPTKPHRKRIRSFNDYENVQIGMYEVKSEKSSIQNDEKLTMSAHDVNDDYKFNDHSDVKSELDETDLRRASCKSNLNKKMSNHARKHVSSNITEMRKHESNKKSTTLPPGQTPPLGHKSSFRIARNTRAQSDYVTKGRNYKGIKNIQKKFFLTKTVSFDKNMQGKHSENQMSENKLSSIHGGRHKKNSSYDSYVSEPFTFGEKNVIKTAHDSDITTPTRLEFKANVDNSLSSDNVFYDQDIPMHAAISGTLERHAVARVAKLDMKEGQLTEL